MKSAPKIGTTRLFSFQVDATNRITFADAEMPAVLSTPWLITYLEFTARDLLAEHCLEPHERSVGTYVEVEHLAPVPEGFTVTCKARVIHVAGEVVTFHVEAADTTEPVARGIHRRRVIDAARFARRVTHKREKGPSA